MTTSTATGRWCGVPRGFSLIEIMVGVVIGLIAAHEGPFQPPIGISPAPIAKLLDIVPDS